MQIKELENTVLKAKAEQDALLKELEELRTKDVSREFVENLAEKTEKRLSTMNVVDEPDTSKLDLRINELETTIAKLTAEKGDLADLNGKLND